MGCRGGRRPKGMLLPGKWHWKKEQRLCVVSHSGWFVAIWGGKEKINGGG